MVVEPMPNDADLNAIRSPNSNSVVSKWVSATGTNPGGSFTRQSESDRFFCSLPSLLLAIVVVIDLVDIDFW